MMRRFGQGLLVLGVLAVLASYMGALHPAGDSLAVIRYPMIVAVAVLALLIWRWRVAQGVLVIAALLLAERGLMMRPGAPLGATDVVLYQKNMLFQRTDRSAFIADVLGSGADVVTLQEVSRANRPVLAALSEAYPYQHLCNGTAVGGIAVLSRWPITSQTCSQPAGIALAEVETGQGPLRVVSLHLHWPWPYGQMAGLDATLPDVAGLTPMPTVLGGDFNMVPWGQSLARVEELLNVQRIGHVERTFEIFGWPLSIDHVMASPDAAGRIDIRARLGSDHYGVLAEIKFGGE